MYKNIQSVILVASLFVPAFALANVYVDPVVQSPFIVTYDGGVAPGESAFLQELAPGGFWTTVNEATNSEGTVILDRSPGNYEYRVRYQEYDFEERTELIYYSASVDVTVIEGEPPVLDDPLTQSAYEFEVRTGDINFDGNMDIHVRRLTGDPNNGVLQEQIILGNGNNIYTLFVATSTQMNSARSWPVDSTIDVLKAEMNVDRHVDVVLRESFIVDPVILVSSGNLFDGSASQIGHITDASRLFMRDTIAYIGDRDYFDDAQGTDQDGYNIRVDGVIGFCYFFYGFPICVEENFVLLDIDVSLEDLGLDSYFNPQSKTTDGTVSSYSSPGGTSTDTIGAYYSPEVHTAAEPVLSEEGIADLHAHMDLADVSMQKLGSSLSDISNSPDTLRCVYFCGGVLRYDPYGGSFSYFYWVDTWTPITIPGEFDSENYSFDAYQASFDMEVMLSQDLSLVQTVPVVADKVLIWLVRIGGALGIGVVLEDLIDKVEGIIENNEGTEVMSPADQAILEEVISTACAAAVDPQECLDSIEDIMVADIPADTLPPIEGDPPVINTGSLDPDHYDEDWMIINFPIVAEITRRLADPTRINCTYEKVSPALNQTYYGRTSGKAGETCLTAVNRRSASHTVLNLAGFLPATVRDEATGVGSYFQVRGREQHLIDSWMVDGRQRINVANIIRGVAKKNPLACTYHTLSILKFGPLSPYTGDGTCP